MRANIAATLAFPKRGKGDRRRRWMRMSAVALRGNALAFDYVRMCAIPLSIADRGRSMIAPTGWWVAARFVGKVLWHADCPGGQSLRVCACFIVCVIIFNKSRITGDS